MLYLKKLLKSFVFRRKFLRKICVAYCVNNELLPEVLVRSPAKSVREIFGLPPSEHESQLNQDIFSLIFNKYKPGFFVEIGANNGFDLSNTVYLEEFFGWSGILVEANPRYIPELNRRRAIVVNKAVAASDGFFEFFDAGLYGGIVSTIDALHAEKTEGRDKIKVQATTLRNILEEARAPHQINFISIDIEGGELAVVRQMCELDNHRFLTGCVEHNFREAEYFEFKAMLNSAGYRIVWENQTGHDLFFVDGCVYP